MHDFIGLVFQPLLFFTAALFTLLLVIKEFFINHCLSRVGKTFKPSPSMYIATPSAFV